MALRFRAEWRERPSDEQIIAALAQAISIYSTRSAAAKDLTGEVNRDDGKVGLLRPGFGG